MFCSKCGTENTKTSKFCIECGNLMKETLGRSKKINENISQKDSKKMTVVSYFKIMMELFLKPSTTLSESINKFKEPKNAFAFAGIISGILTVINLFNSMINVLIVKSYSWTLNKTTTTWVWSNLKELNYFKLIGREFLIYSIILLAIAGIYYLTGLVIKKESNYNKLLAVGAMAAALYIGISSVLAPILMKIYAPIGFVISVVGVIYALFILITGMDRELALEDNDKRIFVHVTCLSLMFILYAYIAVNFLVVASINNFGNLFN